MTEEDRLQMIADIHRAFYPQRSVEVAYEGARPTLRIGGSLLSTKELKILFKWIPVPR